MQKQEVINRTIDYVKSTLEGDGSGHDWWHIYRVWKNAIHIGKGEQVDMYIVELGALLHDIADWKFYEGDTKKGAEVTKTWLASLHVSEEVVEKVCHIVENVSYKGASEKNHMKSIEGFVVQDADRLDAIGAIGIGRTFAYGGYSGRVMYDPNIKPEENQSFEQYKKVNSPTINHFYEKLLLLKDRMNTKTAKAIAQKRHAFMEAFLEEFYAEWDGKI